MWARRCGASPKWPSRVKVVIQSCLTAGIGLAVYNFMAGGDAGYLDLQNPFVDHLLVDQSVLCLRSWPPRSQVSTWFDKDLYNDWVDQKVNMQGFLNDNHCSVAELSNTTCRQVKIPVHAAPQQLGTPMGMTVGHAHDVLDAYSYLFLVLTFCLWCMIFAHDLALLSTSKKDYILDWHGLNSGFPMLRRSFRLLGIRCLCRLLKCKGCYTQAAKVTGTLLAIILVPVVFVWGIVMFMFVVAPLVVLLFTCHPVRMSRFAIFVLCIATAVYGVVLALHTTAYIGSQEKRPFYAIRWREAGYMQGQQQECVCGCNYPVSAKTCWQLFLVGVVVAIKAFMLAFRSLKGLRRSQWANFMTVTFAVPVAVYSVEWTTPDGRPIQHRKEGEPVQGEMAFDPFALMDEQPNSAFTTLTLKPTPVLTMDASTEWKPFGIGRHMEGPKIPTATDMECQPTEYIGCCGFPCLTGGYQAVIEPDEPADEDEALRHSVESGSTIVKAPNGRKRKRLPTLCRAEHGSESKYYSVKPSAVCAPLELVEKTPTLQSDQTPASQSDQRVRFAVSDSEVSGTTLGKVDEDLENSALRDAGNEYTPCTHPVLGQQAKSHPGDFDVNDERPACNPSTTAVMTSLCRCLGPLAPCLPK